jgi:hypothetical protein
MADFYVYALFRLDTCEPFYIGKGRKNRIGQTNRRNPYTLAIIKRMKELGLEVPMIKLRSGLDEASAFEIERALIAAIGRDPNGPLSNMTDGGEGFSGGRISEEGRRRISEASKRQVVSPETREKIRLSKLGKPVHSPEARLKIGTAHKGRKHSEESSEKKRRAMKGRIITEDHRRKISEANKGHKLTDEQHKAMIEGMTGRKLSEEHRRKIALANIGKKHSDESIAKMRRVQKGRIITEEHRRKISAATKGRNIKKEGIEKKRLATSRIENGGPEPGMA